MFMVDLFEQGLSPLSVLLIALVLDAVIGDPPALWTRVPHPVVLVGKAIDWADANLNRENDSVEIRKLGGAILVIILLAVSSGLGWLVSIGVQNVSHGFIVEAIIASILLAGRSLYDHVYAVAVSLNQSGLEAAREAVSRIVGRDPKKLDRAGVVRSALESLAENFSDGVVAPSFWFAIFGIPGICAYKALNTADSMIGYKSDRHRDFGWAAARLDDFSNALPARIAGCLIIFGALITPSCSGFNAGRVMRVDAHRHHSPNAGFPEAAMAGALGVALAGPRDYATGPVDDDYIGGDGRRELFESDIRAGLGLYLAANAMFIFFLSALIWLLD